MFMFFNCVFFIWFYDDKKGLHKSVEEMDLFKIDSWNKQVLKSFQMFLKVRENFEALDFFKTAIENSASFWREINRRESQSDIFIS